ncbi:right-handed parallel beta-helix repeat-containing protein, partial [Candidatus Parcubacteria bacterium]|nr:right-handed parallel beta-helix repeat-containing protein [Candidatus Parcubacteria bacterium]
MHTGVTPLKLGSRFSKLTALFLAVAVVAAASYLLTRSRAALVAPTEPPAQICGNASILDGPTTAPAGAVVVPAGDNLAFFENEKYANATGKTYWFEPGTHTLGTSPYGQIEVRGSNNTFIGAPGAVLDGQGLNKYAITGQATGATIKNMTIKGFVPAINEGVVNQNGATGWTIEANTVSGNKGAGVFLGDNIIVRRNCLTSNGAYGLSGAKPPVPGTSAIKNITVDQNEISYNNTDNLEYNPDGSFTYCGCSGGTKFWDINGAKIINNWVHHNKSVGLWADTNDIGFLIEGNYINDNDAEGIFYEISYNVAIRNNTLIRNAHVKGRSFAARNDNFPIAAIYIAESGGDSRMGTDYAVSEVTGNYLEDNWGGVVLWEAADRFCGSVANTSAEYCTMVNPDATLASCKSDAVNSEPLYSDCRWKTQNISVSGNTMNISKADITGCAGTLGCAQNGIFSNYGVTPPYLGAVIAEDITFKRNNRFSNNTYNGEWLFTVYDQGRKVGFTEWQAAPYNQDAGSTYNGTSTTPPPPPPPPSDTTVPAVNITAPANDATVSGTTSVSANASDNVGVTKVEFYLDNNLQSTATANPYNWSWDTTGTANGTHTLTAKAYDAASNTASSGPVSVNINNATATPPPPPPTSDTGPSVPQNLRATNVTSNSVSLAWDPSTPGTSQITGYDILRDGVSIGTTGGTTATDTTVEPGRTYVYTVYAYDAAFNHSAQSAPVTVAVPNAADTTAPTAPTNLAATAASPTRVDLKWTAASDNVGVTKYYVVRSGTTVAILGNVTGYSDATAAPGTHYDY